ncbi:unnamed protein product [Brachionus calyciflorus]|uniref:Gelsolin-like domain-containing protein n=1 Tax=Brachionus calyciflorus TaxID=104777 RepID=A0A813UVA2_9BILA|nr:unnamed protein product [Brachionus calyciflorus]
MSSNNFKNLYEANGLTIWRVTDANFIKIEDDDIGSFYSGDCYLILNIMNGRRGKERYIHYWLGESCSQSEMLSVSIKAAELEEILNGCAVTHKEVQNYESPLFESYFPNGIKYLKGGYLNKENKSNSSADIKRLFMVKGRNNVKVAEVPFKSSSLNKSDVFIVEDGQDIYVWNPPFANSSEKSKALKYAKELKDSEKNGRKIHIIDNDWDTNKKFWAYFDCTSDKIKSYSNIKDDNYQPKQNQNGFKLYKVSDEKNGKPIITLVGVSPLKKALLDSKDCFIIDCDELGFYTWIGKKCTHKEKIAAVQAANELMARNNNPIYLPCVRVIEGAETIVFKDLFIDWE